MKAKYLQHSNEHRDLLGWETLCTDSYVARKCLHREQGPGWPRVPVSQCCPWVTPVPGASSVPVAAGEGAGVPCQVFKARKNNDLYLVGLLHNRDYCDSGIPRSPFGWLITLALKQTDNCASLKGGC